MTVYSIFAFREDGASYSMGCTMDRSDADFRHLITQTRRHGGVECLDGGAILQKELIPRRIVGRVVGEVATIEQNENIVRVVFFTVRVSPFEVFDLSDELDGLGEILDIIQTERAAEEASRAEAIRLEAEAIQLYMEKQRADSERAEFERLFAIYGAKT